MIALSKGMLIVAVAAALSACEPSSEQKKKEVISEHGMKASETAKEAMSSDGGMQITGDEDADGALKKAKNG